MKFTASQSIAIIAFLVNQVCTTPTGPKPDPYAPFYASIPKPGQGLEPSWPSPTRPRSGGNPVADGDMVDAMRYDIGAEGSSSQAIDEEEPISYPQIDEEPAQLPNSRADSISYPQIPDDRTTGFEELVQSSTADGERDRAWNPEPHNPHMAVPPYVPQQFPVDPESADPYDGAILPYTEDSYPRTHDVRGETDTAPETFPDVPDYDPSTTVARRKTKTQIAGGIAGGAFGCIYGSIKLGCQLAESGYRQNGVGGAIGFGIVGAVAGTIEGGVAGARGGSETAERLKEFYKEKWREDRASRRR